MTRSRRCARSGHAWPSGSRPSAGGHRSARTGARAASTARDASACARHGAAGTERKRGRRLHEWRKRVKDLRYAAEMLDRVDAHGDAYSRAPAKRAARRRRAGKRARAGRDAAFVGELVRRADDLGELLGEEHDLAMLAERVRREASAGRASGAPGPGSRKALLRAIARRRKRLRKRALRDGQRLYARKPKQFVRRMRAATALAALSRR